MEEHIAETFPEYLLLAWNHPSIAWRFRGQADVSWKLLPKAGREEYFNEDHHDKWHAEGFEPPDICRFNHWCDQSIAYDIALPESKFERLALAQHYGLATRLLDWSSNPLVALFFACESKSASDGVVLCYVPWLHIDVKKMPFDSVTQHDEVIAYQPRPITKRIVAQMGTFTYHPSPAMELSIGNVNESVEKISPHKSNLCRIRIPASQKKTMLRSLADWGISRRSLFPDLDGLSESINSDTMLY